MKRTLLIIVGVLIVLALLVAIPIAAAFMGRKPIVDGTVINGIRIVQDGIVSVAVVPVGDGPVMLVDAGNDTEGKAILAELARRGIGPDAVVAIALTHGHADHIGAVRKFPKAQVMALEREVPLVEGREGARGPLLRLMPITATGITVARALHDDEAFDVGDVRVQIIAVPGHTAGSAAYLIGGVLFVGDSADTESDGALRGAPWIFSDSQSDNRASLVSLSQRLKKSGAKVNAIVPAHSAPQTDGQARLDAYVSAQPK